MSLTHCFLASKIEDEKPADNLIQDPLYVMNHFSCCFQESLFSLAFYSLITILSTLSLFSWDSHGGILFLLIVSHRSLRLYSLFTFLVFFFFSFLFFRWSRKCKKSISLPRQQLHWQKLSEVTVLELWSLLEFLHHSRESLVGKLRLISVNVSL